ncbi:MAG: TIGR02449 family protein [Wenzhouxiangellaceae bacterium]|nr:TIGR02449 family protein [Wenzhouxiangellaceae bacterium]
MNPGSDIRTEQLGDAVQLLAQRFDALQRRVTELERENRSLRARQDALITEKAGLVQRNDEARSRVEAMIERLKSMEHAPS